MSIFIHWVSQDKTTETYTKIPIGFACLRVYHIEDMIIKSEWYLDRTSSDDIEKNQLYLRLENYLNNPAGDLMVKLQEQGTEFRKKVWTEICKIPVGQVQSYSELANRLDSGARAIANACRDNPYPGIIPCHRVIAVNGPGGFMGETSGPFIQIKKKLLALERSVIQC